MNEIKKFITQMQEDGRSPRTISEYARITERLFAHEFTEKNIKTRSRWLQVSAVISYLKDIELVEEGETFGLNFRQLKRKFRKGQASPEHRANQIKKKVISPEQFDEFLSALPDTPQGAELTLASRMVWHSGMRRCEVLAVTPDVIEYFPHGICITVEHGKGDKARRVYLPPILREELRAFKRFTISPGYVSVTTRKAARKVGLTMSFHDLRHTNSTNSADAGAPLHELSVELGHSDVNTTMIYTHVKTQIPAWKVAMWERQGLMNRSGENAEIKP